jgi:hypothetical protein
MSSGFLLCKSLEHECGNLIAGDEAEAGACMKHLTNLPAYEARQGHRVDQSIGSLFLNYLELSQKVLN